MLIEKRPEQIKEMSAGVVENLDIFVETVHKDTQANGKTTERSAEFTSAVACMLVDTGYKACIGGPKGLPPPKRDDVMYAYAC